MFYNLFTLSKIIGTALTFQTKHILLLLRTYQKDKRLKILDEFVNKDENFKNRYYLSNYRKLGHSTNKREMNSSVVKRIEKQLNKVESANRFSKAVFFGNNAEFIFATQEEQNIANNCKRLIQNAVILWNYLYIDKKLQEAKSQSQKDEIIEAIKNSSIVHWSHINFYGTYDFTKIDKKVNDMIS